MTDTFSPTRPCRYRNGDEPLAVFSLPSPTEHGDTLVSVSKSGRMCTHSEVPSDGVRQLMRDCCDPIGCIYEAIRAALLEEQSR